MANGKLLGTDKDVEALARRARKAGWTVDIDGGTHIRWQCPDGGEFRCALTGNRHTRLRVERNLSQLDPDNFAEGGRDEIEHVTADFRVEAAAAAEEMRSCAELLEIAAEVEDPNEAASIVQTARNVLRSTEDALWQMVRDAQQAHDD